MIKTHPLLVYPELFKKSLKTKEESCFGAMIPKLIAHAAPPAIVHNAPKRLSAGSHLWEMRNESVMKGKVVPNVPWC
jgi:hypothetical protein